MQIMRSLRRQTKTGGCSAAQAACVFGFCFSAMVPSMAAAQNANKPEAFVALRKELWPRAQKAGVSAATFKAAFDGLTPDPEVLEKADKQPEFTMTPGKYFARLVTEKRITNGKEALKRNEALFATLEKRYGVSRYVLTAIWGIESNYGAEPGKRSVIRSLATLTTSSRRASFGKSQLVAALKILQKGDVTLANMTGSWAGAMGHTQFIPTTYNQFAADYDGDGKRDIWGNHGDALASAANYLKLSGWKSSRSWGYQVKLPEKFNIKLVGRGTVKTAAQWQKLNVTRANAAAFPRAEERGHILLPAGAAGPAFFVTDNFKVTKKYNNSDLYALAVGHLADRLSGGQALATPWP